MEGRTHPGVKNYLAKKVSLGDRVEHGRLVAELVEHPGWSVVLDIAGALEGDGEHNLAKIADDTALSVEPQKRIDYARKKGVQEGLSFVADVAVSVIDSAKTAALELKKTADLEQRAAEGTT